MDLQITDMDGDGDIDWNDVLETYQEIYGKEKGTEIANAMKENNWSNDMGGQLWAGKDYNNTMEVGFQYAQDFGADHVELPRAEKPRMPWQDITSVVYGKAATDVARHFIQRWNFCKKQSQHDDTYDFDHYN